MEKGSLILTPPTVHHKIQLHLDAVYDRYNISFKPELLGDFDLEKVYQKMQMINCVDKNIVCELFQKLDFYFQHLNEKAFFELGSMLVKELFMYLDICEGADSKPVLLNPILTKIIDYINKHLFTIQSVTEICEHLFISKSHLFDIFKSQLGISPKKYINSKRLHAARNAITNGEKATKVYAKVGFSDYTTFYKSYQNFFGCSPSKTNDHILFGEKY